MKIPSFLQRTLVTLLIISLVWLILFFLSEVHNIVSYVKNRPGSILFTILYLIVPITALCWFLKLLKWREVFELNKALIILIILLGLVIMSINLMPRAATLQAANKRATILGATYVLSAVSLLVFLVVGLIKSYKKHRLKKTI